MEMNHVNKDAREATLNQQQFGMEAIHRPMSISNDIKDTNEHLTIPAQSTSVIESSYQRRKKRLSRSSVVNVGTKIGDFETPIRKRRSTHCVHETSDSSPSFSNTQILTNLYSGENGQLLNVQVEAKLQRGFFQILEDWVCYRRNYFTAHAVYKVKNPNRSSVEVLDDTVPCQIQLGNRRLMVQKFSVRVAAHSHENSNAVDLFQFTSKRNRGPKIPPFPKRILSGGKLDESDKTTRHSRVASFARLQFSTSTVNKAEVEDTKACHHVISFVLTAETTQGVKVDIARTFSQPIVVRGRSPSYYAEADAKMQLSFNHQWMSPSQPSLSSAGPLVSPSPFLPPTVYRTRPSSFDSQASLDDFNTYSPKFSIDSSSDESTHLYSSATLDTAQSTSLEPRRLSFFSMLNHMSSNTVEDSKQELLTPLDSLILSPPGQSLSSSPRASFHSINGTLPMQDLAPTSMSAVKANLMVPSNPFIAPLSAINETSLYDQSASSQALLLSPNTSSKLQDSYFELN